MFKVKDTDKLIQDYTKTKEDFIKELLKFGDYLIDELKRRLCIKGKPSLTYSELNIDLTGGIPNKLGFLLNLFDITSQERFLTEVKEFANRYFLSLELDTVHEICLDMALIYLKIYSLTDDKQYLEKCHTVVAYHQDIIISRQLSEYKLPHLDVVIKLYLESGDVDFAFLINMNILELINLASFKGRNIVWKNGVMGNSERINTNLASIFANMYFAFGNETFKNIADTITSKGEPRILFDYTDSSQFYRIESYLSSRVRLIAASANVSKILAFVKKMECIIAGFFVEANLVSTIKLIIRAKLYFYFYIYTDDEKFLDLSKRIFLDFQKNLIFSVSEKFISILHFQINDLSLMLLQGNRNRPCSFAYIGRQVDLPAVNIRYDELRYIILSNLFPKSLLILRDEMHGKLTRFLQASSDRRRGEIENFISFSKSVIRSNKRVRQFLEPILEYEITRMVLTKTYDKSVSVLLKDINFQRKTELFKLDNDSFKKVNLVLMKDTHFINLKLNKVLKIYGSVFKSFSTDTPISLVLRYNAATRIVDEIVIDQLYEVILKAFNNLTTVEDAVNNIADNFILSKTYNRSELDKIIVNKIKNMLSIDLLVFKNRIK
nr:hypothetical protein [uncultured Pedobacter sp.]